MLRQHKRRIVQHIESTIPEHALDMGASVMVMQTTCKTPGCVPLETAIVIVFPRDKTQYIDDLPESCGGSYKTKILLPLSEVSLDDVLDALPPGFKGGRKTWENTCLTLRDHMLGRIGGIVGSGDDKAEVEERKILAEYLKSCLEDYIKNDCVAPELGLPFPDINRLNLSEEESAKDESQNQTRSGDKTLVITQETPVSTNEVSECKLVGNNQELNNDLTTTRTYQ